jgi:hypothetical protein
MQCPTTMQSDDDAMSDMSDENGDAMTSGEATTLLVPFETQIGMLAADTNGLISGAFEVDLPAGIYAVKAIGSGGKLAMAVLLVK